MKGFKRIKADSTLEGIAEGDKVKMAGNGNGVNETGLVHYAFGLRAYRKIEILSRNDSEIRRIMYKEWDGRSLQRQVLGRYNKIVDNNKFAEYDQKLKDAGL